MKVTFISQWYPPENIWVPEAIASSIRSAGHEVSVITGIPHYPSGKTEPGYRAWRPKREILNGIAVHRVPEYPYRGKGAFGRFFSYISFAATSTLCAVITARNSDALFVYASPATSAIPAMVLRTLAKVPFVLQVQDIWPDSVIDSGFVRPSPAYRALSFALNSFVTLSYKLSSKVIVISPSAKELLCTRGVPASKLQLLYNWADDPLPCLDENTRELDSLRQRINADKETRIFFYGGAMGPAQDLASVIKAFSGAGVGGRARLVLAGSGVCFDELRNLSLHTEGVHVLSAVPLSLARHWTSESNVGVVSLANTALHKSTFPSKIQLLTGMGMPLLVRAPGDASTLAEETGSGIGVSSSDGADLAGAFRRMARMSEDELEQMGRSARLWYERSFSSSVGSKELNQVLLQL